MSTTKQLMTSTGGMVTTDSHEIYEQCCRVRQYGEPGDLSISSKAYQTEGVGCNYKLNEMVTALARVKLRHLDDYTACAQQLCRQLTERLRPIQGLSEPFVSPDCTHTYYYFSVQVHPDQLNLEKEPGKLRAAAMQALSAEKVVVSGWQTTPVAAQLVFQKQNDPQTRCHPWNSHGKEFFYDIDEYPNTCAALENSFVVWQLTQPSTSELVERYGEAFEKVFANIDRVVKIYERTTEYIPLVERKKYRVKVPT